MREISLIKSIHDYLQKSSYILWLMIIATISLLIMIIASGLPIDQKIIKKAMFYFCYFLWGLTGTFLIYKKELVIGPFKIEGNVVPIFGICTMIYFWVSIIIAYL